MTLTAELGGRHLHAVHAKLIFTYEPGMGSRVGEHGCLDELALDAEGDEIFVHTHIYRHTPMADLFHKSFAQFEGSCFNLCIQLPRFHCTLDQFQSGHQVSHSGNLHCTFAFADL